MTGLTTKQAIRGVFGTEPRRDGEYPTVYMVGSDGVTRITESTEDLGTYGIHWFHAWKDDVELARMNAVHIETVAFFPPVPEGAAQ